MIEGEWGWIMSKMIATKAEKDRKLILVIFLFTIDDVKVENYANWFRFSN